VLESDFYHVVLRQIYEPHSFNETNELLESSNLAVLFMILALGTLFDPQMPPQSPEASQYYHLGRAALSLDSPLETQSIIVVQALVRPHYNVDPTFLIVTPPPPSYSA
jgi:hypothetical protein